MESILLISCPDRPGLIHAITGVLLKHGVNVVANDEFVDPASGRFFMRTEFTGGSGAEAVSTELADILPEGADVRLHSPAAKRIIIFASREPHCVGDLLLRQANGELPVRIEAVVSNHAVLGPLAERFGVPYFHVPVVESGSRSSHEAQLLDVASRFEPDYIVLAKYMRILSAEFVARFPERIINIHHSFLPAFVGAQPYRQAYDRGVKIIGATAHFVTEALDEGPIIAQSVLPVTHAHTASSMAREGREIEKIVLAQALKLVIEDRVFVSRNKTIIFD